MQWPACAMSAPRSVTCYVATPAPRPVHDRFSTVRRRLEALEQRGTLDSVECRHWPVRDSPERTALLESLEDWCRRTGRRFDLERRPIGSSESYVRLPAMGLVCRQGDTVLRAAPCRHTSSADTVATVLGNLETDGWPVAPVTPGEDYTPGGTLKEFP